MITSPIEKNYSALTIGVSCGTASNPIDECVCYRQSCITRLVVIVWSNKCKKFSTARLLKFYHTLNIDQYVCG